jgi:hypothetical protein
MIGIYKIRDEITGKEYIGQSKELDRRINTHKRKFANDDKSTDLYRFCKKPTFKLTEECEESELDEKEIYWIEYYDTFYNGLNMTLGGEFSLHSSLLDTLSLRPEKVNTERFRYLMKHYLGMFVQKEETEEERLERVEKEWIVYPRKWKGVDYFFKNRKFKLFPNCIMTRIRIQWKELYEESNQIDWQTDEEFYDDLEYLRRMCG